jgi:beta-propeller repeat-containing protein/HYDIN/CFA65/VesB family protein
MVWMLWTVPCFPGGLRRSLHVKHSVWESMGMRRSVTGIGFALCLGVLSLALLPLAFIYGIAVKGTAKTKAAQATSAHQASPNLVGQPAITGAPYVKKAINSYGKLPLAFEPNWGQQKGAAQFLARGDGYSISLAPTEAVFALSGAATARMGGQTKGATAKASSYFLPDLARQYHNSQFPDRNHTAKLLRMKLVGANPAARFAALDPLPGHSNYFVGSDPRGWRANIPNYRRVEVEEVYPGIDLLYYGSQRQLEYDFVIRPGHDPRNIQLEFGGAGQLRVDAQGDLVLGRQDQRLRFLKPVVYQQADGTSPSEAVPAKNLIASRFVILGKNRVGFRLGDYDRNKDLVIDPTLSYSTFLGGANKDIGSGIAVDGSGSAYVAGETCSPNFPTVGPLPASASQNAGVNCDAFVTKFDPSGATLVYSTFLGGSHGDSAAGIAVDIGGNAYVTGLTSSTDFPTTAGAFQTVYGGGNSDVFVTKLNAAGSALIYSTYIGGNDSENGAGIAVDSSGNANVAGQTCSANYPVANAFQPLYAGNCDAFISKLNAAGSGLVYSTYVGGTQPDAAYAIAVDSLGAAFITGATCSDAGDFPLKNSLEDENAGPPDFPCDAFVAKTGPDGVLAYSTFLGDTGQDAGYGITVDSQGFAYITGFTASQNFLITQGALDTTCGTDGTCNPDSGGHPRADAFVTKLSVEGSALVYSTFLGGSNVDIGYGIAVDINGNAYVTGATQSTDFPMANPEQAAFGGGPRDAFVTKLNAAGSGLIFSSYLGGADDDAGNGIAVDSNHNMYVTGSTSSNNFPTTAGAFQPANAGSGDAFVTKIANVTAPVPVFTPNSLSFGDQAVGTTSVAQIVTLTNAGDAALSIIGIQATGDFGQTNNCGGGLAVGANCSINVSFSPTVSGVRTGSLSVNDNAANSPQSITLTGNGVVPPADFSLSVAPPSAAVPAGKTATYTLTVAGISGFAQQVNLSCSGAPPKANCLFSANPAAPNGSSPATVTVSVATALRTMAPPSFRLKLKPFPGWPLGLVLACLVPMFILVSRQSLRGRRVRVAFGFAVILMLLSAGCNSGSQSGVPAGTPAGVYQVIVTGTSGSLTHSITLNLQVN